MRFLCQPITVKLDSVMRTCSLQFEWLALLGCVLLLYGESQDSGNQKSVQANCLTNMITMKAARCKQEGNLGPDLPLFQLLKWHGTFTCNNKRILSCLISYFGKDRIE